jgi:UDP-N-acetylmuramoyl-L-alanyl-D-glutamate--2,6-diaminopimelate ligase
MISGQDSGKNFDLGTRWGDTGVPLFNQAIMLSMSNFKNSRIARFFQDLPGVFSAYHFLWSWFGAVRHRSPSRRIFVIGITGTKGKTTTLEILNAILEAAGKRTAILGSYRIKIGDESGKNILGNSMPGHGYIQRFLSRAVVAGCTYALVEVTSQGVSSHRHRFIHWNVGAITNLAPEHIEAHGSFENYRAAKLSFLRSVAQRGGTVFLNRDDASFSFFQKELPGDRVLTYGKDDVWISQYLPKFGPMSSFQGSGSKGFLMTDFNQVNAALAVAIAREIGIPPRATAEAIMNFAGVPGRMEFVRSHGLTAVVDYAHTPDSLEAAYRAVKPQPTGEYPSPRLICILGSVGATGDKRTGRDVWKRPEMGKIAAHYCDKIFLSNEDPYYEDPMHILDEIEAGIMTVPHPRPDVVKIVDRHEAIRQAVADMKEGDVVIGTGKGSEDWMHVANGKKIPWNERKEFEEAFAARANGSLA